MPVKYWSRAGLMLTDWCCASCDCCYACCSPSGRRWMTAEQAIAVWQDLTISSPHGCRIHLTGGEVFGNYDYLLDVCRIAYQQKLTLEAIETNAFWATDAGQVRRRLLELAACGMGRISISSDPYHQQHVPIDRPRLLARVAQEVLGTDRVRVRWRDWLDEGVDVAQLSPASRKDVFRSYAALGRDRLIGRAASHLEMNDLKPIGAFVDNSCATKLLRGQHVHISPDGDIWLATCVGISAGNVFRSGVSSCWQSLRDNWHKMPVVNLLCQKGPCGLMEAGLSADGGFSGGLFASKCHLCHEARLALLKAGICTDVLSPAEAYGCAGAGTND